MKGKLLIICDAFEPPMYGTRVRNLAQNLLKRGWEVHIACEKTRGGSYGIEGCTMHEFVYYGHGLTRGLLWVADKLLLLKERRFGRFLEKELGGERFEYVLSSAYLFPLGSVRRFVERHGYKWLLDLRDIVEQWGKDVYLQHRLPTALGRALTRWYIGRLTAERNRCVRAADAVTVVSEWHREVLHRLGVWAEVVYNGYDAEMFAPQDVRMERFRLIYTGRLYERSVQDPSLLFEALGRLQDVPLTVEFYTDETSRERLERMVERYQVGERVVFHGLVQPEDVPQLLQESSVVLVFSNRATADGPHGILTTKFFEALGVEKPVLCVRSDEECLAQLIDSTRAGVAARDVDAVERFVREKYGQWKRYGFTRQGVNEPLKRALSRQEEAEQVEKILLGL